MDELDGLELLEKHTSWYWPFPETAQQRTGAPDDKLWRVVFGVKNEWKTGAVYPLETIKVVPDTSKAPPINVVPDTSNAYELDDDAEEPIATFSYKEDVPYTTMLPFTLMSVKFVVS